MSEEPVLSNHEKELMEALGGLAPAAPGVTEQALWYEAGFRRGRRRSRISLGVAAAAVVLASGLAVVRPKPAVVYVERPSTRSIDRREELARAMTSSEVAGRIDYVRMRDAVEEGGMDAISEESGSGAIVQPTLRAWSPQSGGTVPGPWGSISSKG